MRKTLLFIIASVFIFTSCQLKDEVIDSTTGGDQTSTVSIKVKSPNGGESIMEGSSYNIQWTATGVTNVKIQFSFDNGSSWQLIADSLKNNGIYSWFPIPNLVSNQCKIRISSIDGTGADESDQSFAIIKNSSQSLKMISPVGGESWEAGTAKKIQWYSSGLDSVKIEYTTDNGNHWNLITVDKKNTGIYYWEPLPNTPSTLAKVRIMDAYDGDPSTESTNTFNIVPEPKLRIISPNGGETLYSGGNRKLEWISENIENVKIAYTTNNGSNWNTIIESTPSIGFYNWVNVPNLISQNCKIRIYDAQDGEPWDVSDSVFTITNQVVQVLEMTTPNGGEKWQAGTAQNITWNSGGVPKVKLEYTINNGLNWNEIINQLPNTGAYEWNVPNSLSTQCLIRISDSDDGNPIDQSNSRFSIVPKPDLKILYPNGGEIWAGGQVDTIRWYSVGVEKVALRYSTDAGFSWQDITQSTESDGEYIISFTMPSKQYKIRIEDAVSGYPIDESDGTFTVTTEPSITVVTPNGSEEWFAGSRDNIKWISTNIEEVKLDYTTNNGATWSTIVNSVPSNGVFSWNPIPNVSSTQCRIRISDSKDGIPSDISDENFTINNVQLIKVKSPNGSEGWETGSSHNITWDATGIKNVKIEFTTNNGISWNTLEDNIASSGFYTWEQIPNMPSTNCKVRISDADDGAPSDESDQFFSIIPQTPAATINVDAPNGGESWLTGTSQEIRWTSENVSDVKIEFTTDGGANWTTIIKTTPSIGTYKWDSIPNVFSLQCKIRVSDANDGTPFDLSDNNFQISNQIIKSLQVLSPNGGENWEAGTKQNITWNSSAVSNVKLELTTNQGASWATLADNITGGAYEWNIDQSLNSTQCQVRVSDATDNTISDISNGTFTISPIKSIRVTSPVGPITFKDSDPITITWESTGIKTVGIKYTTTNGVGMYPDIPEFYTLVDKIANQGSFTTSFSLPSDQYYVVVYNADEGANGSPSARNIGSFTIVKTETPAITLLSPNGGEQYLSSKQNASVTDEQNYHPFEIRWHAAGLEKVKIEWSTTGGGTWYVVPGADSTTNDGSFVWAPGRLEANIGQPRPDSSDNCLLRISSLSGAVLDRSDSYFSIHESKKIQVLAPNGGEYYYLTADEMTDPKVSKRWPLSVTWSSYAISGNVNIYYSLQNGAEGTWKTMILGYPSTGIYGWDYIFGSNAESMSSTLLRIKIVDAADDKVWDTSDTPANINVVGGN